MKRSFVSTWCHNRYYHVRGQPRVWVMVVDLGKLSKVIRFTWIKVSETIQLDRPSPMTGSMQRFDSSPWSLSRNKLHTSNCNRDTTGTGAESAQINLQPAPPAVTLKVRHVIYMFIDASLGFSCYFYVALHVKLCVSSYLFYLFYDCGHVFASQWRWFTVVDGRDWRLNIVCLVCDGSKGRCTAYDVVVGCWRHILNFISGSFAVTAETIVVIESYT